MWAWKFLSTAYSNYKRQNILSEWPLSTSLITPSEGSWRSVL